jgi:large subunit ribosomal protein L28
VARTLDVEWRLAFSVTRDFTDPNCAALGPRGQILYNLVFAYQVLSGPESGWMAQVCDICGKKPMSGNTISHAHNVSKRRWNVNLRPVHAKVGASTKRMRVCTSCLRSGKVVKA